MGHQQSRALTQSSNTTARLKAGPLWKPKHETTVTALVALPGAVVAQAVAELQQQPLALLRVLTLVIPEDILGKAAARFPATHQLVPGPVAVADFAIGTALVEGSDVLPGLVPVRTLHIDVGPILRTYVGQVEEERNRTVAVEIVVEALP